MPQWRMHAPPASAADAATAAPGRSHDSTNVIDTLHLAAIGATGGAHYPPHFERFETLGRTRSGWNWAAALCTLGWLVYRRLWGAALAYAAVTEGLALLWFTVLRPWLQPPAPVEAGLGLALALLSCVVPGLWGDALVYTDVRRRTLQALEAAPTLAQARTVVEGQAPTRRRLQVLVALHAVLAIALLAALCWLPAAPPANAAKPAAAARPATPPASTTAPPASTPEVPQPPAPAALAAASAPAPAASLPAPPAPVPPASAPARQAPQIPQMPASKPRAAPARQASAPVAQTLEDRRYYINVGVFADAANAAKVQQQLQRTGLPVVVQTVGTNKGDRTRVRAGPFTDAGDANAAAGRIRGLGLEAVVFLHK
jgi:cell division protein FtsN